MEKKNKPKVSKPDKKSTKKSALPDIDLTNPEFNTTLDLLTKTSSSVFLTGKAGTGKSTFLKYIAGVTKKRHVILAPTGIAAVNVGGQTIHSFFKIPLKPLLPDDPEFAIYKLRKRLKYNNQHIKLIKSLDLIIIDEISMVRADVIDFIDKILRVYTGNMRLPFGGKQLLLVGDIFQLEPVVTGNDKDVLSNTYSSFYFFNAKVFKEIALVPIELTKVYRQNESRFIELLNNIRMGRPTQEDILLLNTRINPESADPQNSGKDFTMTIATRRDMVDQINESHLRELRTPEVTFEGQLLDDFPSNALPTDLNLKLKAGAQVVFIKNDPDKRWVNGTLAVVDVCQPDNLTVRTEDGVVHKLEPEAWNHVKYTFNEQERTVEETILGSFIQYPLKLAWALTIHKSQGLTFNRVIIDLGRGAFSGGQTYVALSRCRSLSGITLRTPVSPRDIYVHPKILEFASQFNSDSIIKSALETGRAEQLYKTASDAFNAGNVHRAVNALAEAVSIKNMLNDPTVVRLISKRLGIISKQKKEIELLKNKLSDNQKRFDNLAAEYTKLGDDCRSEGWDIQAAIRNYNKALELSPLFYDALIGRGMAFEQSGDFTSAEADYNLAISSTSTKKMKVKPILALGDMLDREGDVYGAISRYLEAFEYDRKNLSTVYRLVEIYDKIGDKETADEYRKIIRKIKSTPTKQK